MLKHTHTHRVWLCMPCLPPPSHPLIIKGVLHYLKVSPSQAVRSFPVSHFPRLYYSPSKLLETFEILVVTLVSDAMRGRQG